VTTCESSVVCGVRQHTRCGTHAKSGAAYYLVTCTLGSSHNSHGRVATNMVAVGVAVLVVTYAVSFLGYTIVYGNMSYWGCTVITCSLVSLPNLLYLLLGGVTTSSFTLLKLYTLHFILGIVVLALGITHLYLLHRGGTSPLHIASSNHINYATPRIGGYM